MPRATGSAPVRREMEAAAEAAAEFVQDGMVVGLGTGSTVACLLDALATRRPAARYIATSPGTEQAARERGLEVMHFRELRRLDLTIDGAAQISSDNWLLKGLGGAHTREKVAAAAADAFVVIVSSEKLVHRLTPPLPVELLEFGLAATLERLALRLNEAPRTPDGHVLADYMGELSEPAVLARRLADTPGVVEHGLFPPELVSLVVVGRGETAEIRELRGR